MSPLFGPDAGRVLLEGTRTAGTLVGIQVGVTSEEESSRFSDYAVEAGGTTFGIRQDLAPDDEIRLGMPVTLVVHGNAAVVEWGDSGTYRWKMLKTPPARGIVDDLDDNDNRGAMNRIRRGTAATVTLLEFSVRAVALGLGQAVDARVRAVADGGEPYEATIKKIQGVPGYAAHLPVVGATLPAWVRSGLLGESLVVDWATAANADPGIGRAPAPMPGNRGGLRGDLGGGARGTAAPGGSVPAREAAEPAVPAVPVFARKMMDRFGAAQGPAGSGAAEGDGEDAVSWQTFLDVQHQIDWGPLKKKEVEAYAVSRGVPAGEWPEAQRRWQLRMGSDPALMAEYGQLMSRP